MALTGAAQITQILKARKRVELDDMLLLNTNRKSCEKVHFSLHLALNDIESAESKSFTL